MNIWLYWENKINHTKPAYLNLCYKSIINGCGKHNVSLLNEQTIRDIIPDINPKIFKFPCVAHKADYIRAKLVHSHGGFWFDTDTILWQSIDKPIKDLENSGSDFIGCGRSGNRPSIGFFGGYRNSKLLDQWIKDMDIAIDNSTDFKFNWTALGYDILWKHSATYNYYHYPFNICMPYFSGWKTIFFCTDETTKNKYRKKITSETLTVALYNSMFPQWFKNMTEHEILKSNYYIADLFKEKI
jgi:hypothetical protein